MKKKLLIALVAVVAVVGVYIFLQNQKSTNVPQEIGQQPDTAQLQDQGNGMRSLRELLSLGTSQKCTFTSDAGGQSNQGTAYIASGKVRIDAQSRVNAQGTPIMSHIIIEGNTMKMWQDGETMGMTMTIPQGNDASAQSQQGAPSYDEKVDYQCQSWSTDASLFVAPTTIMFHSMDQMMQMGNPGAGTTGAGDAGMMEGMEPINMDMGAAAGGVELKERQCRLCEDVTGAEAKAECRVAFQCE